MVALGWICFKEMIFKRCRDQMDGYWSASLVDMCMKFEVWESGVHTLSCNLRPHMLYGVHASHHGLHNAYAVHMLTSWQWAKQVQMILTPYSAKGYIWCLCCATWITCWFLVILVLRLVGSHWSYFVLVTVCNSTNRTYYVLRTPYVLFSSE